MSQIKLNKISATHHAEQELLILTIRNSGMPILCLELLEEFQVMKRWIKEYFSHKKNNVKFIVSMSEFQDIFSLGGDLSFFHEQSEKKDFEYLKYYAHLSVDAIHTIYKSFDLPAITIALTEGKTYGGGFEFALAHDYILSTTSSTFILPEKKLNLFAGMGAYSLLNRKLTSKEADRIVLRTHEFTANELLEMELVNKVVKKQNAFETTLKFIRELNKHFNFELGHIQSKKIINPLKKEELEEITNIWVEATKRLNPKDIGRIKTVSEFQKRKIQVITLHSTELQN